MRNPRLARYSIRTAFIAIAMAACVSAWYANNSRHARELDEAASIIARNGGCPNSPTYVSQHWMVVDADYFDWLTDPLKGEYTCVEFGNGGVTDQAFIDACPAIKRLSPVWLALPRARLTKSGYGAIAELNSLRGIDLTGSSIQDDDLAKIAQLPDLRYLDITETGVTDAGIKHLKISAKLEELLYDRSNVSSDSIDQLRKLLPALKSH